MQWVMHDTFKTLSLHMSKCPDDIPGGLDVLRLQRTGHKSHRTICRTSGNEMRSNLTRRCAVLWDRGGGNKVKTKKPTSSWVWPTWRWWCPVMLKNPADVNNDASFPVIEFRSSLTVLSPCHHNLKYMNNQMIMSCETQYYLWRMMLHIATQKLSGKCLSPPSCNSPRVVNTPHCLKSDQNWKVEGWGLSRNGKPPL